MSSEITSNNPVVKAIIEGTAPRPAQLAASRGLLPLPETDMLEILVTFFEGIDPELKENSLQTLRSQQTVALEATVRSAVVAPSVLAYFAGQEQLPANVHEAIITNPNTPPSAIVEFATNTQNGALLELVSFNQQLLIRNPEIIDAIIGNSNRTPEALG